MATGRDWARKARCAQHAVFKLETQGRPLAGTTQGKASNNGGAQELHEGFFQANGDNAKVVGPFAAHARYVLGLANNGEWGS